MRVGYAVPILPNLASYRLRVAIPAPHLGCEYVIGTTGKPTFFFKAGNVGLAEALGGNVVYDVVNDHFKGPQAADYHGMCSVADTITVGSVSMAETVMDATGRHATVIDDPYEGEEKPAFCYGNGVAWFGHSANLQSLLPYLDTDPVVCTNTAGAVPWSLENEQRVLQGCAVALLTGSNRGASSNRVVKAIRAGRFVVCPADSPVSWAQFAPYIWIGNVKDGIRWALNNREEACNKITQGQKYTQERFSPKRIGEQWMEVFAST